MTEEFDYPDFTDTTDLVDGYSATYDSGDVVLTTIDTFNDRSSLYRTVPSIFDEDWSMTFRIAVGPETSEYLRADGSRYQADGWAIVWAPSTSYIGSSGGAVGYFGADFAIVAGVDNTRGLAFRLWEYLDLIWSDGGAITQQRTGKDWRGDNYYWVDYAAVDEELSVYYSATPTKPDLPTEVFTGVSFGTGEWYVGITAATGSATMNSRLKAWALTAEEEGAGWGLVL